MRGCGLLLSHVGNEDTGEDLRAFVAQVTRVAEVGDFGINRLFKCVVAEPHALAFAEICHPAAHGGVDFVVGR